MTEAVADAIRNRYPVTPPVAKAPEAQPVDVMDPNQLGELFEQMNGRQEESPQEQQPSFNYEEQMAVQPDNAREIEIIQSLSENQLKALMYFGMPWEQISPDAESLLAPPVCCKKGSADNQERTRDAAEGFKSSGFSSILVHIQWRR